MSFNSRWSSTKQCLCFPTDYGRTQLIAQKGYTDAELPTAETIGSKLNALGYYPQKVAKSQPQKKSPKLTPSSTM